MFRMIFGLTPAWIKRVEREGKPAMAVVKTAPRDVLEGVAGYSGRDGWVYVDVVVHPRDDVQFEGKMHARYSQTIAGVLAAGSEVNVKYDPQHKDRILLVEDLASLFKKQLKIDG